MFSYCGDRRDDLLSHRELASSPKKWILLILFTGGNRKRYNEPVRGKTRLVKEIFLLTKRAPNIEPRYRFRPDKYGPNSIQLLRDLTDLQKRRLIQSHESFGGIVYSLTQFGVSLTIRLYNSLDKDTKKWLVETKTRYNSMPLNHLLNYVYSAYPEYAVKSEYEERFE